MLSSNGSLRRGPELSMQKAAEYRKRAEECRAIAGQLRPGQQRTQLLDMAQQWERMASQIEVLLHEHPELSDDETTDTDRRPD
jgi:hypothetical protein